MPRTKTPEPNVKFHRPSRWRWIVPPSVLLILGGAWFAFATPGQPALGSSRQDVRIEREAEADSPASLPAAPAEAPQLESPLTVLGRLADAAAELDNAQNRDSHAVLPETSLATRQLEQIAEEAGSRWRVRLATALAAPPQELSSHLQMIRSLAHSRIALEIEQRLDACGALAESADSTPRTADADEIELLQRCSKFLATGSPSTDLLQSADALALQRCSRR